MQVPTDLEVIREHPKGFEENLKLCRSFVFGCFAVHRFPPIQDVPHLSFSLELCLSRTVGEQTGVLQQLTMIQCSTPSTPRSRASLKAISNFTL